MILDVIDPTQVDTKDFAPFIGYVCVYEDEDEEHVGILSRVARYHGSGVESAQDLPYFGSTQFYLYFQGVDFDKPVAVIEDKAFTLELHR